MTTMNSNDRAKNYFDRLKNASNRKAEAKKIADEIETLVWASTKIKLTKLEKIQIIDEIERLALGLERIDKSESRGIFEASENSGILDVISAIKKGVKD